MFYRCCLLVLLCMYGGHWVTAQSQSPLDLPVSLSAESQTLFDIFQALETNYPIRFFYREEWIPRDPLSIDVQNTPIKDVLDRLLATTSLDYEVFSPYAILIGRKFDLVEFRNPSERSGSGSPEGQRNLFLRKEKRNIIGDSTIRPLPVRARIEGRVFNPDSDEGLVGVSISFPELQTGTFTDSLGRFQLEVPTGVHRITVSAAGRESRTEKIWVYTDGEWEIDLNFTAYQLEEVTLEAEGENKNVSSIQSGVMRLSPVKIRNTPNLLGEVDVLNAVALLPGVSTVGEAARGLNVRGGNIDQNLILQDGSLIFNTAHLLGFFSVFNPDMVKGVTLYKGNIPAQYGGRIASVLEVELEEGSYRRYRGRGSIGALASKFSIGGPIVKGRTSFLAGIRAAYPDLAIALVDKRNQDIKNSSAYYGDMTLKLSQKIGQTGNLSFTGYASTDYFRFAQDFGYGWQTLNGSLKWNQIYSDQLSSNVQISAGTYQSDFFNNEGSESSEITNGVNSLRLHTYVLAVPVPAHTVHVGVEANYYDISPNTLRPFGEESSIAPRSVDKGQGLETGIFINDEFRLNNFLGLSLGLRWSHFVNVGPGQVFSYGEGVAREVFTITDTTQFGSGEAIQRFSGWEPRIAVRVNLSDASSVKLSYNRIFQYTHLLSNSAAATPVDLWQLAGRYVPAQRSHSFSLGFFRNLRNNTWQLSTEVFYRNVQGVVVNRDFARLLLNEHIETELLEGEGQSYGGELSIQYRTARLDIRLAYTYSRSLWRTLDNPGGQQVNGGDWFPADFDTPHNISLSGQWKIKKRSSLGFNFVYRTGRPVTAPIGLYELYPNWNLPAFSDRNQFRIPDYHRIDLSYTLDNQVVKRQRFKSEFVFSIYNLYGRDNAFSVFFQNTPQGLQAQKLAVLGTILPTMSYNFRF